jgi:uncharacterized protein YjiS (DUF1127 family)
MNSNFLPPKHSHRFHPALLVSRGFSSWVGSILERWNRLTYRLALQRLEQLNDHALRDIGLWREPESRVEEWWKMNPPP